MAHGRGMQARQEQGVSLSTDGMPLVRPLRGQVGISAIAGPFW